MAAKRKTTTKSKKYKTLEKVLKQPVSFNEIKTLTGLTKKQAKIKIDELRNKGIKIESYVDQKNYNAYFYLDNRIGTQYTKPELNYKDGNYKAILTGDWHIGSKYFSENFWLKMFDIAQDEGITDMYMTGDLIDGVDVFRGQHNEINIHSKMEQLDYLMDLYPVVEGMKLQYICLSPDTLVFTKEKGWIDYKQLKKEMNILSIKNNGKLKFNKIKEKQVIKINGKLLNFKSSNQDMLVTPDHFILEKTHTKGKLKYRRASSLLDLKHSFIKIPTAGILNRKAKNINEDLLKLIAWVVTDGTFLRGAIQIYQNKDRYYNEIIKLLKKLNYEYGEYNGKNNNNGVIYIYKKYCKNIFKYLKKKLNIEWFLKNLNDKQLLIFFNELMKGDGNWKKNNHSGTFYTSNYNFAKQIVELCVYIGYKAKIHIRKRHIWNKNYITYDIPIVKQNHSVIDTRKTSIMPYKGIVFDITTEEGNFLAMRNGCPFFTGNCGNHDLKNLTKSFDPGVIFNQKVPNTIYLGQMSGDVQVSSGLEFRLIHLKGNAYCFDDKTEILTKNGFKFFKDITKKDKVAMLNKETNELEWKFHEGLVEFDWDDDLIHFKGQSFDLLVTPNHKMWAKKTKPYGNENWGVIYAQDMFDGFFRGKWRFKRNAKWKGKEWEDIILPSISGSAYNTKKFKIENSNYFLKFLGWFISEGFTSEPGRIFISQEKKENIKEIIDSFKGINLKPYNYNHGINSNNKRLKLWLDENCGKGASNKKVPEFVKELKPELIKIFLISLFKGDGSFNKKGQMIKYYTISKKLRDDVMELLLKIGKTSTYNSKFYITKKGIKTEIYSLNVGHVRSLEPQLTFKPTLEKYKGKVYCITTKEKNAVVYVMRNGKTMWSVRSRFYNVQKYLRQLPPVDMPDVLLRGHNHQIGYAKIQGVHSVETGAFQRPESNFVKGLGLTGKPSFVLCEYDISDHKLDRFKVEFVGESL